MMARRPDGRTANSKGSANPPGGPGGFNASAGHLPSGRLAVLPSTFVGTFPDPATQLEPPLAEIAFIGRSNVGKSSLINALLGKQGMARVSGTPGKTRALNVFQLPGFYLVDLPGYGYAKADKSTRAAVLSILERYIRNRETLAGIVWLLDIRRDPSADDHRVMEQLASRGHPVLAVLTKADKLVRSAQLKRSRELGRALGLEHDQVQVTSSTTGLGIAELARSIAELGRRSKRER
jgi:GTP-binding protein